MITLYREKLHCVVGYVGVKQAPQITTTTNTVFQLTTHVSLM